MTRKVLQGASFDNSTQFSEAIMKYVEAYNDTAEPFQWKRE